jgi:putative membrane protein
MSLILKLSAGAAAALTLSACAMTPPADPAAPARLAGTSAQAQAAVSPAELQRMLAGTQPMPPMSDMDYAKMAGASDLFEIESSRLALEKSQNPAVRDYAQMMIAHHTTSTQALMERARMAGMTMPPPMLMPDQVALMAQLRAAPAGAAFDQAYWNGQTVGHRKAWALHTGHAQHGQVFRNDAATVRPVVELHLVEIARRSGMS